MRDTTIGFGALALSSAIWGGMYVASDALMRTMPPLVAVEFREAISAVLLLAIAGTKGALRIERRDVLPMIGVGVVGFSISIGFQFYGTDHAGAALGSLVTASSPVLIAVLGALVLGEHVPLRRWLAMGVALVGVVVIVGAPSGGPGTVLGVVLLLIAGVCWALYTIGSASLLRRYSALTVVTLACTVGAIASLPIAVVTGLHAAHPWPTDLAEWGEVLYISVVGMAVAFFLWVWGFTKVSASRGGVLLLFQPVVGMILGVVLLGERLGPVTILGSMLVCAGVAVAVLEPRTLARSS